MNLAGIDTDYAVAVVRIDTQYTTYARHRFTTNIAVFTGRFLDL